jgi:CelD/BcsL family acetyltransferase involved in cellulose biosynthesis
VSPSDLAELAGRARSRPSAAAALPEPFHTRIQRKRGTFSEALDSWSVLAGDAAPLFSPELVLLTARQIDARRTFLVGARHDRGPLVAALPLARRGRTLVAVRGDHTPRVDLVGDPAALPSLWRAVRDMGGWDALQLRSVPADSPLAVALPALAEADGFHARVRETHRVPWFLVEDIEQRIHRRFRGDMRRLERQLGGVELERVTSFDRPALQDILRLEAAAWKGAAGTAIASNPRDVRFYEALARIFARRGRLTLAFLRARGARIAAIFALEDATTFYLMKTGYDPEFAHYGPGQLLVRETAIDACRRGLVRYDMLGRDTPWKMKWTEEVRSHVSIDVYAPSLLGRTRYFVQEVARPLAARAAAKLRR